MNASNWTVIAIAFLIGGGIFLALHSLRGRLPRARDVEDTHKPPHRYDAALQALNVLGIDPDARDDDGGTPMHRAAGEGRVEIIELLYAAGANPNARDNRGRTPLHRAASDGKVTKVEALVAAGADINARDNDGATPLHHATAYNGSYEEGGCAITPQSPKPFWQPGRTHMQETTTAPLLCTALAYTLTHLATSQ